MSRSSSKHHPLTVYAKNIGGIDDIELSLPAGVSVLVGRNATNRTSFLQALRAAFGCDEVPLKADADRGHVRVDIGDKVIMRELRRDDDDVIIEGEPYLEDSTPADLFAFLLESNEARRAVARGDDLRSVIMEPVDTEAIEHRIRDLVDQKDSVENRLAELDSLADRLPKLKNRRAELRDEIEATRAELQTVEDSLEATDDDVEQHREEKADLQEKLAELQDTRSDLESVRFSIDSEKESLQALQQELQEHRSELESLPMSAEQDVADIEDELDRVQSRREQLSARLNELQNVIQFNEQMLGGEAPEALGSTTTDGSVTDALIDEEVTCWTCGSSVDRTAIESTLDRYRERRRELTQQRTELKEKVNELTQRRKEIRSDQQRREELERRVERTESEIESREQRLADLRGRRTELVERIDELETAVQELKDTDYSDVLKQHRQANELEFELERLETDLTDIEDEIATIQDQLAKRSDLKAQRDDLSEQLTDLRGKVKRIEKSAIETFNQEVDAVLSLLEYKNIDRVWVERISESDSLTRGAVDQSSFRLHIVRSTDDGAVYEDTVDHLSESEREVIGIVFALAGFLAHEVYENVPVMLLDSLEALDSDRIAALLDYVREYADNIVVALLPEDASSLDEDQYQFVEF